MVTKISKISNNIYSVNDSEIPLNHTDVINLCINLDVENTEKVLDILDKKGSIELKTAERGTVVNIYEVEYPPPKDPDKETQQMVKHLDEYEDFITQNLFPGVDSENVIITTDESLDGSNKIEEGKFFTEKDLRDWNDRPVLKASSDGKKYIEIEKESWRLLPDADYDPAKEKGWGMWKDNKVERDDVIKVGNTFFKFIRPIRSTQLKVGEIYGSSYYEYNSGYDIFKFKGLSYTPDSPNPEIESVRELLQIFGVNSLKILYAADLYLNWKRPDVWRKLSKEKKVEVNEFFKQYPKLLNVGYIPDFKMWMDWYNEITKTWEENVDYFYLFEGRWARGSGAEKLTFWEVEEVAPSPKKLSWLEILI